MLSQISQSSKRLGKLKKYKNKVKQSGFQFLLQSLQRDKQNHAPNRTAIHNNLSHSIQIDPLLTAPVQSFTLSNCNTLTNANNGKFYLDNVKFLDRSDITISQANQSIPSKKSTKHRENSHKISSKSKNHKKEGNKNVSSKSKNSDSDQIDLLIYKMKHYLSIVDDFIDEIDTSKQKQVKKAKVISHQIINLIQQIEKSEKEKKGGKMSHSINTTSFNIYGSQIFNPSKQSQEFVKRINGLEVQRDKLTSLISQHEMANIKMYIKLNEGESQQIQQCKKQLSLLFEKYKKLQNYITSDKKRIAEMIKQKEQLTKRCQQLNSQNIELMNLIQKYQLALQKQNREANEKDARSVKPMRISMLQADKNLRQQSYFQDNGQQQKSYLRLQSLCNQSRLSQDMALSSTKTTSTSRMNKKGGRLGINLTSLLENLNQNQLQKMAESPEKLKKMMRQCKQAIVKMEHIIQEQNKQLQLSITSLSALKSKIDVKDDKINKLQSLLRQEKTKKSKQSKYMNESESKSKRVAKKDQKSKFQGEQKKKVEIDQKGKLSIDLTFKKTKFDQYRIIAMQALALQQAINSQHMR